MAWSARPRSSCRASLASGRPGRRLRENQIASLGVGRKFQTPSIFANLTVRENLELALVRTSKGVLATLRSRLTGEQGDRVQATLESIGLSAEADLRAGGLSHGQKQW